MAPACSAAARPGDVSGLALKLSASDGTVPDRMGQDGRPGAAALMAGRSLAALAPAGRAEEA